MVLEVPLRLKAEDCPPDINYNGRICWIVSLLAWTAAHIVSIVDNPAVLALDNLIDECFELSSRHVTKWGTTVIDDLIHGDRQFYIFHSNFLQIRTPKVKWIHFSPTNFRFQLLISHLRKLLFRYRCFQCGSYIRRIKTAKPNFALRTCVC